ncbi:hypothetical protein J0683_24720, partial [Vibrio parahaemolyticus]|nr:hypothetical protein [Vibrio parahaemolyticus]
YGIKDLFKNHPEELQSHKYPIIQKLRQRISDDDNLVRDVFYQLFDIVIFPLCKEVWIVSFSTCYFIVILTGSPYIGFC